MNFTETLQKTTEQASSEFFKKYKASVTPILSNHIPGCETGPVEPWSSRFPYDGSCPEWRELMAAPRSLVFPDSPFAKSAMPQLSFQTQAYAMWDFIFSSGIPMTRGSDSMKPRTPMDVKPARLPYVNKTWTEDVHRTFISSRGFTESAADGFGDCVIDLPMQAAGKRWLDAAHVLVHRRCDKILAKEKTCAMFRHGILQQQLCKAVAEIAIAHSFGLPIDTVSEGLHVTMPYGIYVSVTNALGFEMQPPLARLPLTPGMCNVANKVLAVVSAVVQTGYDTTRVLKPGASANFRADWWSYQPVRTILAGWQTAAWMAAMPIIYQERTSFIDSRRMGEFASHVDDLESMYDLAHFIVEGRRLLPSNSYEHPGQPRFTPLLDWMESEDLKFWLDNTQTLPCNTCMCVPFGTSPYGLAIPSIQREERKADKPKDWVEYWAKHKVAVKDIKRAKQVMYNGEGRYKKIMAVRLRAHNIKITQLKRKINERKKYL